MQFHFIQTFLFNAPQHQDNVGSHSVGKCDAFVKEKKDS